jgi:integrase
VPRPPTPIGAWGRVSRQQTASGQWRARARFRDFTGHSVQVEAWGSTGASAQRRLEAMLRERAASAGEDVTPDMRLHTLGRIWLAECESSDRAPQTVDRYRDVLVRIIEPGLGQLRIREASVGALDRFLKATAATRPAQAKHAKVVLAGMLGLAVRHDAIRTNPIRDVVLPRQRRQPVRALTVDDVVALRRGVALWIASPDQVGRRRTADLLDVVDLLLATGARVGEVCGLRWDDVDLAGARPTVTISGTLVRVAGEGLTRQPHPKTASGHRTVVLPRFAVETLMRRKVDALPNAWNVVFPSSTGTLRDPHNLRRQWRDARAAAGFDWVTPHTFRKTVATMIDRETTTAHATAQLGHATSAVTTAHYIERAAIAPDVSGVLQALGGQADESAG